MERIIASVRAKTGDRLEVLGQVAGDQRGRLVCVARDHGTGSLVALVLTPAGAHLGGGGDYSFEILAELGSGFLPVEAVCDVCGTPATDLSPTCSTCGMRMTSAEAFPTDGPNPEVIRTLTEAAAGAFEILGAVPRAAGLAPLYFGRENESGNVVPLSPRKEVDATGSETLTVNATQLIWMSDPPQVEPDRPAATADQARAEPPAASDVAHTTAEPVDSVESAPRTEDPPVVPPVALGPVFGRLPPEDDALVAAPAGPDPEADHREAFEDILRSRGSEPDTDATAETTVGGWETTVPDAPEAAENAVREPEREAQEEAPVPVAEAVVSASMDTVSMDPVAGEPLAAPIEREVSAAPSRASSRPSGRMRRRRSMLPIIAAVLAAVVVGFFTVSSSGDIARVRTAPPETPEPDEAVLAATPESAEGGSASSTEEPAGPTEPPQVTEEATLRISGSLPETAVVSVDGIAYTERTVALAAGSHRVSIRAEGHVPLDSVVVLEPGRTVTLSAALRAEPVVDATEFVSAANALDLPLPSATADARTGSGSIEVPEPLGTPSVSTITPSERTAITPPPLPTAPAPAPPPAPAAAPAPSIAQPPVAATVAHEPLNLALHNFAAALESRSIEMVAGAYPGMTQAERSTWMEFFGSISSLRVLLANVEATPITGDIVQIPFTLVLEFADRGGVERSLRQNHRATFIQRPDGWKIEAVRPN